MKRYLMMGNGEPNDFFCPYDKLATSQGFIDGFEFVIQLLYKDEEMQERFMTKDMIKDILDIAKDKYGKDHSEKDVELFRIGGGVAYLTATAHEIWSENERQSISDTAIESFSAYICDMKKRGKNIQSNPESLAREYKESLRKEFRTVLN